MRQKNITRLRRGVYIFAFLVLILLFRNEKDLQFCLIDVSAAGSILPSSSGYNNTDKSKQQHFNSTSNGFSVEAVDYQNRVSCGYHKCFFPLLKGSFNSTSTIDETGYVLLQEESDKRLAERFESMRKSWALAVFIQDAFPGVHQLALEEPQVVQITAEQATKLNRNLYYDEEKVGIKTRFWAGQLIVQKQKSAPNPSLAFGTTKWKKHLLFENIEPFMKQHVVVHNNDNKTAVVAFVQKVGKELERCHDLIEKVRCLGYDFQVFIAADGTFYHFDLDRCFLRSKEREEKFMTRFERRRIELWDKVQALAGAQLDENQTKEQR